MRHPISAITKTNENTSGGCFFGNSVYPKLTVNQPNDRYEQEADAMADRVMRMESGSVQTKFLGSNVQRKCAACEEEEAQRMPLMRRVESGAGMEASAGFSQELSNSKGGGHQLPAATQERMGQSFGTDFSMVKVHTDSRAAEMSHGIQARAFTHGSDIYFNKGQYQPGSSQGDHLLAHELTHTIQQGNVTANRSTLMKSGDLSGSKIIQRDDAGFESGSGLDTAITAGTMAEDAIVGTTATAANCRGTQDCNAGFKFSKAYKGTYPYAAANRDVRGVYVKIESVYDHSVCSNCDQIRFIQTVQNVTRGAEDNIETADPGTETRRERSGWDTPDAPSRGWRVDRVSSANRPFYGESGEGTEGFNVQVGSPSQPAILWDAPGDWVTDSNAGKDFQTFLVCETTGGNRQIIAGVSWGYYTDSAGTVNFRPSTPIASCGPSSVIQDAAARWDGISGNQATGIDFAAETPARSTTEQGNHGGLGAGVGAGIGALAGGIGGAFAGMALEQTIGTAGAIGAGIGIGVAGAGLGALIGWGIGSLFGRDNEEQTETTGS